MKQAIQNTASMVRPGGHLILALYNRHWTSPFWLIVKWLYNNSPPIIQKTMVTALCPIIYGAKFIVTGKNPKKQSRGMDFYYDVIDWVGGYPYESAAIEEVESFVLKMGFKKIKSIPAQVPTGCNEFIFVKR
jgi:2-polyprenyl-6-hydroxyphenyl methylase/3-demethylubiquinone-9 3-methyltransferase